jgi:hypothetical protein
MQKVILALILMAPTTISPQNSFMSYRTFSKKLDKDLKDVQEHEQKNHLMKMIHDADDKIKENQKDILSKQNMVYAYNYLRQSLGLKTAPSFYEIDRAWITQQNFSETQQSPKEVLPEMVEIKSAFWVVPTVVAITAAGFLGIAARCCMLSRKVKQN